MNDMKFTTAGDIMSAPNGFRTLQERLREEGWYVGWNHYCCQNCAWMDVPDTFEDGTEVDLSKVLFNHSQDCEYDMMEAVYQHFDNDDGKAEECLEAIEEAQYAEEDGEQGAVKAVYEQFGILHLLEDLPEGMLREGSFVCYPPEQQHSSVFCFAGDKQGVKNLKAILPIIEECGCEWSWDQKGNQRIEISWEIA